MAKHRCMGHSVNGAHFTGRKAGKRVRRKGTTRKMRRMKRGGHVDKYGEG